MGVRLKHWPSQSFKIRDGVIVLIKRIASDTESIYFHGLTGKKVKNVTDTLLPLVEESISDVKKCLRLLVKSYKDRSLLDPPERWPKWAVDALGLVVYAHSTQGPRVPELVDRITSDLNTLRVHHDNYRFADEKKQRQSAKRIIADCKRIEEFLLGMCWGGAAHPPKRR